MRTILFKGKEIHNGIWIQGYYMALPSGEHAIVSENSGSWRVCPETVGQYTGVKDATGEKIFEGDILNVGNGKIAIVEYYDTEFCLRGRDNTIVPRSLMECSIIVGNIHDTPAFDAGVKAPGCQWFIKNCCIIAHKKEGDNKT